MSLASSNTRFDRRSLLRGAIAVAAASTFPLRRSYAAEAVGSTGKTIMLSDAAIADLQKSIKGTVILPSSPEYETARQVWNPGVDRRPALIAKVTSVDDIRATVQFARTHNILTAVKSGGHMYGGDAIAEKGLVIDVSPFKGVEVDKAQKVAVASGGSFLGDLDNATVPLGLAVTAGVVSHTGLGGLATALGQGRLCRTLGYTIDNVRGVEIVTPDGRLVSANAKENPDLYWAIRGGGGNFGIVTKFEFQLHEFEPNITSFSYTYGADKIRDVLTLFFELADKIPNEGSLSARMATSAAGEATATLSGHYFGSPDAAAKMVAPFSRLGEPIRQRSAPIEYLRWQSLGAGAGRSTEAVYYRSGFFDHADPDLIKVVEERFTKATRPDMDVSFGLQGGVANKIAPTATAFPHRNVMFQASSTGSWADLKDTAKAAAVRKHADDTWGMMAPMSTGGYYVNYVSENSDADVRRAFAGNYERLVEVKTKYDPDNFLHLNPNIKPSDLYSTRLGPP